MRSWKAVVCVLLTIYFTSSHALECYDCIFYDGYKNSDLSCQNRPTASSLKTCEDTPSPLGGEISVCKKMSGFLDGKPVVVRECSRSFSELDGTCTTDTIRIEKSSTNDAEGCICSGDRCNGSTSINEATYISLFGVVVIRTFYGIVSAEDQYFM